MEQIRNRFSPDERTTPRRHFIEVLKNREDSFPEKDFPNTSSSESSVSAEKVSTPWYSSDCHGLEDLIRRKASAYGVDEDLVRSVIRMESGGNPKATSKAGAMGLMQLMPSTAEMLGVRDAYDPEQNIDGGIRYLKSLLEKYNGREDLSLAAYHSGPSRVDRYGGIPPYPAVNHYVKCVLAMTERAREK